MMTGFTNVSVDDTGETLTLVAVGDTTLAGTPLFTVHTERGDQVGLVGTIATHTITVSLTTALRRGEVATVDYTAGLTDSTVAVTAKTGMRIANISERTPDVESNMVHVDQNLGGLGNLSFKGGLVKIFDQNTSRLRPIATTTSIGGRWTRQVELMTGKTYTFVGDNGRSVKTIAL